MSKIGILNKKHISSNPIIDVIFLHGLTGDPDKTWESESNKEFWPNWLVEDLDRLNIFTLGYSSSIFEKWASKEMDLFERAGNLLDSMVSSGIGNRPIVFVTHSLGGILAKLILRKANDSTDSDFKKIIAQTELVIFYATPHTGASLANILSLLPISSSHIKVLGNDTGFLEDLNQYYRNLVTKNKKPQTVAYYEKFKTAKLAEIVDRHSADPGVPNTEPIALDKNHINICKPIDRDDLAYLGLKRHLKNLYETLNVSLEDSEDYTQPSNSDRRPLLDKLIDANREHEYSVANDSQNRFARKIARTGLFTSARNDYDKLLNEIQTRFILHVYHPLICKGGSDTAITSTIQLQIIDPLIEKKMGQTIFTTKDILCAIYYLTEQCHIRWDPEN